MKSFEIHALLTVQDSIRSVFYFLADAFFSNWLLVGCFRLSLNMASTQCLLNLEMLRLRWALLFSSWLTLHQVLLDTKYCIRTGVLPALMSSCCHCLLLLVVFVLSLLAVACCLHVVIACCCSLSSCCHCLHRCSQIVIPIRNLILLSIKLSVSLINQYLDLRRFLELHFDPPWELLLRVTFG